jgi:hypothetical protein
MEKKKRDKVFCAISMVCEAILLLYYVMKFIKLNRSDDDSDNDEEE